MGRAILAKDYDGFNGNLENDEQSRALDLYKQLRDAGSGVSVDQIRGLLADRFEAAGVTPEDHALEMTAKVLPKVAQQTTEEEWIDFCSTGDLPPIKLTQEEMAAIGGGFGLLSILVGTACGGAIDLYTVMKA